MDQVVVKGPGYRSEDCKAGKEAGSALARVKKVVSDIFLFAQPDSAVCELAPPMAQGLLTKWYRQLENERKKLAQREPKGPKPVIPAVPAIPAFAGGPRKGG